MTSEVSWKIPISQDFSKWYNRLPRQFLVPLVITNMSLTRATWPNKNLIMWLEIPRQSVQVHITIPALGEIPVRSGGYFQVQAVALFQHKVRKNVQIPLSFNEDFCIDEQDIKRDQKSIRNASSRWVFKHEDCSQPIWNIRTVPPPVMLSLDTEPMILDREFGRPRNQDDIAFRARNGVLIQLEEPDNAFQVKYYTDRPQNALNIYNELGDLIGMRDNKSQKSAPKNIVPLEELDSESEDEGVSWMWQPQFPIKGAYGKDLIDRAGFSSSPLPIIPPRSICLKGKFSSEDAKDVLDRLGSLDLKSFMDLESKEKCFQPYQIHPQLVDVKWSAPEKPKTRKASQPKKSAKKLRQPQVAAPEEKVIIPPQPVIPQQVADQPQEQKANRPRSSTGNVDVLDKYIESIRSQAAREIEPESENFSAVLDEAFEYLGRQSSGKRKANRPQPPATRPRPRPIQREPSNAERESRRREREEQESLAWFIDNIDLFKKQ